MQMVTISEQRFEICSWLRTAYLPVFLPLLWAAQLSDTAGYIKTAYLILPSPPERKWMSPHWNWLPFIASELYHFKCLCDSCVPLLPHAPRTATTPHTPPPPSQFENVASQVCQCENKFDVKDHLMFVIELSLTFCQRSCVCLRLLARQLVSWPRVFL